MSRMIVCFVLLFIAGTFADVQAQTATSESFLLEMGELLEGEPQTVPRLNSARPNLRNTFGWYNGFPLSASSSSTIQLEVDSMDVDFGALTPGVLVQKDQFLTINSNIQAGYQLYLYQDHPLQILPSPAAQALVTPSEREIIPNTQCDDGACTIAQASQWLNPDIYGFGYTVIGANAETDFANGQAYRGLPNAATGEQPVVIARKNDTYTTIDQEQLQIRYQVGVAPANVSGEYTNTVSYTLISSF